MWPCKASIAEKSSADDIHGRGMKRKREPLFSLSALKGEMRLDKNQALYYGNKKHQVIARAITRDVGQASAILCEKV